MGKAKILVKPTIYVCRVREVPTDFLSLKAKKAEPGRVDIAQIHQSQEVSPRDRVKTRK